MNHRWIKSRCSRMSPRSPRAEKSVLFKTNGLSGPNLCPRKRLAAILTMLLRYQFSNARFNRFSSFGP